MTHPVPTKAEENQKFFKLIAEEVRKNQNGFDVNGTISEGQNVEPFMTLIAELEEESCEVSLFSVA